MKVFKKGDFDVTKVECFAWEDNRRTMDRSSDTVFLWEIP